MSHIELNLLGGFRARFASGAPVRMPTRKARALLAYLAFPAGRAHPRDKLAALLWGNMGQERARTNLRQTLFTLRRAIGTTTPEGLPVDGATLALNPAVAWVDAARFETLAADGGAAALADAAALYQGDLLEGLVIDEPPFEEWLMAERVRLRELALEALANLLAHQRAAGAKEAALQTGLRLISLDPFLEPVQRAVMHLYVQMGRRGDALHQYHQCKHVLERELGVAPEAETSQLYAAIVQETSVSAGPDADGPRAGARLSELAPTVSLSGSPDEVSTVRWGQRWLTALAIRIERSDEPPPLDRVNAAQNVAALVEDFGARVEEVTPGGVMAVFGIEPIDDGPRRAIHAARAALRILRAASSTGSEGPSARCVVHCGRYLMASDGSANRLDARSRAEVRRAIDAMTVEAGTGDVLLDSSAVRFVERRFALEPVSHSSGSMRVVGGGERLAFEGGARSLTPLVGRSRDLETLNDLLQRAAGGDAQCVGLVGEPGVGKSRLVYELVKTLDASRVDWLEGRCLLHGQAMPYLAIADLVRSHFEVLDADSPANIAAKVTAGLERLGLDPRAELACLLYVLGVAEGTETLELSSPEMVRERALAALAHVIQTASRRRPLLIVVEDLHWIDPTSEEVLRSLVDRLGRSGTMFLTTYRPGYRPPWLGHSNATQLIVRRLTQDDGQMLVASVRPDLPVQATARIAARGDGVPFFLEELARSAGLGRQEARKEGLPDTIDAVLIARLEALPAEDRQTLEAAAIIGKDVPLPVLEAIGGVPVHLLRQRLARLQEQEFVYQTSVAPAAEYTFRHALTREAVYGSLPEGHRCALHAQTAAAIERLAPDTSRHRPEVLALHHTLARQAAMAVDYWHRAAERALERGAYAEALSHSGAGLEVTESLAGASQAAGTELKLRLTRAMALMATQGWDAEETVQAFEAARSLCGTIGDAPELFPALLGLWRFYLTTNSDAALEIATKLLSHAEERQEAGLLAGAHGALGQTFAFRGELARSREHLDRAVTLATPEISASHGAIYGQHLGSAVRSLSGWTLAQQGYQDQSLEACDDAVALAKSVRHPFSIAFTLEVAAHASTIARSARVRALAEEMMALSSEHGFPYFLDYGRWFSAHAAAAQAPLALRSELAKTCLAASATHLAGTGTPTAEVLIGAGCFDDALRVIARVRTEGAFFRPEYLRLEGEVWFRRPDGDANRAERLFLEARDVARQQGARVYELRAATSLAELWAGRGKRAEARAQLAPIYHWFTEGLDSSDLVHARALLDSLA